MMKIYQRPIALEAIASIALLSTACASADPDADIVEKTAKIVTPAACRIDYSKVDWEGGGGFRADVTLANVGGSDYAGWTLGWKYSGDQSVLGAWNGVVEQVGSDVKVSAGEWNRSVAPGESTTVVLVGTVTTSNAIPSSFSVNGTVCGAAAAAPPPPPPSESGSGTNTAWRPFAASSPWNTPIAAGAAVDATSAALVADFATSSPWPFLTINIDSYSVPLYYADGSTPLQTVTATVVGGQGFETGQAVVPIPQGAAPAAGTDQHLSVVNRQTNQELDMWTASNGASGWSCAVCAMADLGGSGVRPPTENSPWWMGHGARACGFPLTAGLITVDEMRQGSIEHALALAYPHIRSRYCTPPASTAQVTTDQALPYRGIACGARVQLDPSLNLDAFGLSPSGKIVARALQKYGAFVGDFSGAVSLYAEASESARAAWSGVLDAYEIKDQIDLRSFRVLAIGTLFDNGN